MIFQMMGSVETNYVGFIFSLITVVIVVVSIFMISKIFRLLPKAKINKQWKLLRILLLIFTAGNIINAISFLIVTDMNLHMMLMNIQTIMATVGAVFVLIVIRLSIKTYNLIVESAK